MVKHVLADGTVLHDITNHIVRREDAETVYLILERRKKSEEIQSEKRESA